MAPFHLSFAAFALDRQFVDEAGEHAVDWTELGHRERRLVKRADFVVFQPNLDARLAKYLSCVEGGEEGKGKGGKREAKEENACQ